MKPVAVESKVMSKKVKKQKSIKAASECISLEVVDILLLLSLIKIPGNVSTHTMRGPRTLNSHASCWFG